MPPVGLLARIGHQVRMRKIGLTAAPAQRFGGAQRDRRWRRGNSIREVSVEPLGCGESRQIGFAFVPQRRGTVRFKGASLFRTDPLGLVRSSQRLPLPGRLVVLPRRYPVAPFALPGARRLQRRGVANAGKVGESEDFLGLRDYRPGDSPKQIHWRSWARMGRPIVRENEDEYFTRHALILDTFCTENETDLLDAATSVAASLALTAEDNESLLDLVLVEDRTYRLTAGRGVGDVTSLLEVIANARPAPRSHLPLLAAALRPLADSSSGAIFVLLGWDDERAALVRETALAGVATLAILIRRDGDPAPDLGDTIVPVRSVRTGHLAGDLLQL